MWTSQHNKYNSRIKRTKHEKFHATVQSIFCSMRIQVHHLDLDFYDHYFKHGAYLTTDKEHMKNWH